MGQEEVMVLEKEILSVFNNTQSLQIVGSMKCSSNTLTIVPLLVGLRDKRNITDILDKVQKEKKNDTD